MSNEMHADLIGLQNALLNTSNVDQFLHELAVLATRAVTDGVCCGMALRQRGRGAATAACTDPLAAQADEAQYRTGEGPCLHAMRHGERVHIDDITSHGRWPRFCGQAESLGIGSCLAVPLTTDGQPVGALTLYARRRSAFGPDETRRADRFGRHASGALTLALRMAYCEDLNNQLRSSIGSRAIIDQALGVIMATERCPQHKAFALLRSASQNTNVKLRELAATIVTSVSGEPPRPASPFEED